MQSYTLYSWRAHWLLFDNSLFQRYHITHSKCWSSNPTHNVCTSLDNLDKHDLSYVSEEKEQPSETSV